MDIVEVLATLWNGRWLIFSVTALFVLAATMYAFLAAEWFQAEVVLTPAHSRSISGGALSSLGGLANLAGLAIPAGEGQEPIALLRSRDFARQFIEERRLTTVLLADNWDATSRRWKEKDPKQQPDIRDAVTYFTEKVRTVGEDKKTGLVTLQIRWKDGVLAADWANYLARRLNDQMRQQAMAESERTVQYLQKELVAANVLSLQQSIAHVLESEMQKLALARANEDFAFKVVDHAVAPRKRVAPQRALAVTLAAFAGALGPALVLLFRQAVAKRRTS